MLPEFEYEIYRLQQIRHEVKLAVSTLIDGYTESAVIESLAELAMDRGDKELWGYLIDAFDYVMDGMED